MASPRRGVAALLCAAALAALVSCAGAPERRALAADWQTLGDAWLELERWEEAGTAFERALELDHGLAGAAFNLARARVESGRPLDALHALEPLLAREPGNTEAIALKAYALWRSGDAAKAREVYAALAALVPADPAVRYNLAVLDEAAGNLEEARAVFSELAALDPRDADSLRRLAAVEAGLGDRMAAQTALEAYLALRPGDAKALADLALLKAPVPAEGESTAPPSTAPAPSPSPSP